MGTMITSDGLRMKFEMLSPHKKEEAISFYSHLFGFFLAIIGTIILIRKSWGVGPKLIISSIYGISVIFLFLSSSLYHFFKKRENENSFWRKLDHTAIFFMIAGAYTLVSYLCLEGIMKWTIIIAQWTLVLGGIFFKFFYLNAPRYLYTMIYFLMGWTGIIVIKQLINCMNNVELLFLVLGALSYTLGALFYVIKRPKRFHEIFHFFILAGAFFHYIMIYNILINS